jgi:DNA-directed RNA polymerase subunit RPC12/RpoP
LSEENGWKGDRKMLKCPACGRCGGPFHLRHQIQADDQVLRSWACPCGHSFHASAGAERSATIYPPYNGFTMEWNGKSFGVRLQRILRQASIWSLGRWTVTVAGPPSGPGTRVISLETAEDGVIGEWRLDPGWGIHEIARRIKAQPLPSDLEPEMLARLCSRLMN